MPNVLLVEDDPVPIILQKSLLNSIPNVVVTAVPDSRNSITGDFYKLPHLRKRVNLTASKYDVFCYTINL